MVDGEFRRYQPPLPPGDPLRPLLALALTILALAGTGGCSLPGSAAPTATPAPTLAAASAAPASAAPPTATVTIPPPPATPTATTPSARPATPATPPAGGSPTAVPRPATPGGSPTAPLVVQDARRACELTLPAGVGPTGTPGNYASADGRVLIALQSLAMGPGDALDDLALPFVGAFMPTVAGYAQTAIIREGNTLRIDFSGGLPTRGDGTLTFRQFGAALCVVTFFVADGAAIDYDATYGALIASLRPTGVG